MSNAPDQMAVYLKALRDLAEAQLVRNDDDYGYRSALRNAWNLYDGLSREEQASVLRPDHGSPP